MRRYLRALIWIGELLSLSVASGNSSTSRLLVGYGRWHPFPDSSLFSTQPSTLRKGQRFSYNLLTMRSPLNPHCRCSTSARFQNTSFQRRSSATDSSIFVLQLDIEYWAIRCIFLAKSTNEIFWSTISLSSLPRMAKLEAIYLSFAGSPWPSSSWRF